MSFYKEVPGRKTTLESTLKFDTTPTAGSTNPVTSGGVATAMDTAVSDVLDDKDEDEESVTLRTDSKGAEAYTVGYYFEYEGKIYKCTDKSNSGGVYTITGEKQNGVVPVINDLLDKNANTATKPFANLLTNSNDLNNIIGSSIGDVLTYYWNTNSIPLNGPFNDSYTAILRVYRTSTESYAIQMLYRGGRGVFMRYKPTQTTWSEWKQVSLEAFI